MTPCEPVAGRQHAYLSLSGVHPASHKDAPSRAEQSRASVMRLCVAVCIAALAVVSVAADSKRVVARIARRPVSEGECTGRAGKGRATSRKTRENSEDIL